VKLWARSVLDDQELETAKREIADELAEVEAKLVEAGTEDALASLLASADPLAEWQKMVSNAARIARCSWVHGGARSTIRRACSARASSTLDDVGTSNPDWR